MITEHTMIEVESSQIHSIGYDPKSKMLVVNFKRGGIYQYSDVPQEVFDQFMAAPSKGKFLGAEIKGKFEFKRLNPIPDKPKEAAWPS